MLDLLPDLESERRAALHELGILDTPPDTEFEGLVRAAALACDTPIATVALIDADRQWFKASVGLCGRRETPRAIAFCDHTIRGQTLLEVADTRLDPAFAANPLVTHAPFYRFYAGVPLRLANGHAVGALCVIDHRPRRLDERQRMVLHALAKIGSVALDNWAARREAERQQNALRRSEEFLDRTGRIAGVGGWEWDIQTGKILWSAETCRIHGVAPGYRPSLDEAIAFYAPEAQPVIRAAVHTAMQDGGGGWDLELPFVRADGTPLWVRAAGVVTHENGRPIRVSGAFQDITHRVAARAALRCASERETALFHNSPDILYTATTRADPGPSFIVDSINPAITRLTGWQASAIIGHSPDEWLPENAAALVQSRAEDCIARQTTVTFQMTCATPLGARDFEGSVTPITAAAGSGPIRLVGVLRDVTDENAMRRELHHRQKMDTIGRLAAGVAHDFNNILQSVYGSLELVLEDLQPGTVAHDTLGVGLRSARRGSYLTHHLLAYARKQMLIPRPIALPALLEDVRALLSRTLGPGIVIDMRCDADMPVLHLDAGQLQTALLNLAINAADAMQHAGTLTIEACPDTRDGENWVRLTVADTGSGMDAATLSQAVDPFFTTKGPNGTGLGLSMVQGFAEQSGGKIQIASQPGQGTRVELRLPGAGAPALHSNEPASALTLPARPAILVVDDDPDVLGLVAAFLEKSGYAVLTAPSGDQALALLAGAERIGALVTDYAMPGLNGADLITRARTHRPGLPAVLISGFVELSDAPSTNPSTTIVHKPFKRDELTDAVRLVMGGRREGQGSAPHQIVSGNPIPPSVRPSPELVTSGSLRY